MVSRSAGANTNVPPVPVLEGGDVVTSGQLVTVRWSPVGFDVEELELLLSVDGGRTFPIRVSPELEATRARYAWRVPNLGAPEACIRIRARLEGREVEGPAGPIFRILAAPPSIPGRRWLFHEGGWWVDTDLKSLDPSAMHAARGPSLQGRSSSLSVEPPVRALDSPPEPGFQPRPPAAPTSSRAASATSNPSLPRSLPLLQ